MNEAEEQQQDGSAVPQAGGLAVFRGSCRFVLWRCLEQELVSASSAWMITQLLPSSSQLLCSSAPEDFTLWGTPDKRWEEHRAAELR